MRFPIVSRRRYDFELNMARLLLEEARTQRDNARDERSAFKTAAQTAGRQFADADATNRRLMGRNLELGRRLSRLGEADPEYAGRLEARITRLLKVIARLYAGGHAQKLRADRLQARLDDACGLNSPAVAAGEMWQQRRDDKRGRNKEATS
jgi:hypothetical protein